MIVIVEVDIVSLMENNTCLLNSLVNKLYRGQRTWHVHTKGYPGTWEVTMPLSMDSTENRGNEDYGISIVKSECRHSIVDNGELYLKDPQERRLALVTQNQSEDKMKGTSIPENVSTRFDRIAKLAREGRSMVFTTLAHHIDIELLKLAYIQTNKSGAVGIDGQTAKTYAENLENNLQDLLNRFKSGLYKAPPVRRVYIPKPDGNKRPIGIPTFEDKILQRAVTMVLSVVYENDFLDCSYGFRPKRSAHQALEALWSSLMKYKNAYVVEIDIKDFFGSLKYPVLRSSLDQRVRDGVIRRTIDKWLKAGVIEEGQIKRQETGTPQGGVISPLLANIYLHEVLDQWFENEVKPRLKGKATLIRYADDAVLVFDQEIDAKRVMDVLPKRFGKYGLTLHPIKTKLINFNKPKSGDGTKPKIDLDKRTFDFLGFTHYWGKSRKGNDIVQRKTAKDRFKRALQALSEWCRIHRHDQIEEQWKAISRKIQGHYAYYGITFNMRSLAHFAFQAHNIWFKWLNRRSQRGEHNWQWFNQLLTIYPLPPPKIVHSYLA